MATKDDVKEEDKKVAELQPVGDGADGDDARAETQDADVEDTRAAAADDDGEDKRVGGGRDDEEEDEHGNKRPRLSRAEKNARRNRARDRDRTELRYLRSRNEQLEQLASTTAKRMDKLESDRAEERLNRLRGAIRNADATIIKLAANGEEAQAQEAQNIKAGFEDQLRKEEANKATALRTERAAAEPRGGDESPTQDARPAALPRAVRDNIEDWRARNRWYDSDNPGMDENIVHAIDKAILDEGEFDPRDPEYYKELDRRVAEHLPHRAKSGSRKNGRDHGDDDDERGGRDRDERRTSRDENEDGDRKVGKREPRGPVFRVGGRERPLKDNEVYLSKERRKALEDMGAWDDQVLRKRYLQQFKKYDEENNSSRNR